MPKNRIIESEVWKQNLQLTKPYRIAGESFDRAVNAFVVLKAENGLSGVGSASPMPLVCGETMEDCMQALQHEADILHHADASDLTALTDIIGREMKDQPAARAAIDMALYDLHCKTLNISVCDFLGRKLDSLETSVTIGITTPKEAQAELESYLANGFRIIKLKIGDTVEEDIEIVRKLREWGGSDFRLRVDGNQGYRFEELDQFIQGTKSSDIELIEQPLRVSDRGRLAAFPHAVQRILAADEDLISEADANAAIQESHYGIWNLKLMKSGGISSTKRIAGLASAHGVNLMWGCNDESRVSIAAALHAAFSCEATRFLDLDGSFDIAKDIAEGGFVLINGKLQLNGEPGLGVRLIRG